MVRRWHQDGNDGYGWQARDGDAGRVDPAICAANAVPSASVTDPLWCNVITVAQLNGRAQRARQVSVTRFGYDRSVLPGSASAGHNFATARGIIAPDLQLSVEGIA